MTIGGLAEFARTCLPPPFLEERVWAWKGTDHMRLVVTTGPQRVWEPETADEATAYRRAPRR